MSSANPPPKGHARQPAEPDSPAGDELPQASPASAIHSEALLRGQPSVAIHHQGAVYRLQTTRQGKLILTK